jgi:hypothetical protein
MDVPIRAGGFGSGRGGELAAIPKRVDNPLNLRRVTAPRQLLPTLRQPRSNPVKPGQTKSATLTASFAGHRGKAPQPRPPNAKPHGKPRPGSALALKMQFPSFGLSKQPEIKANQAQSRLIVPNRVIFMAQRRAMNPTQCWIFGVKARRSNLATHHSTTPRIQSPHLKPNRA